MVLIILILMTILFYVLKKIYLARIQKNEGKEFAQKKYEKDLELRNIVIDKVLIGLVIIIAGYMVSLKLEFDKSNISKSDFYSQEKYKSIKEMHDNIAELHSVYSDAIGTWNKKKNIVGSREKLTEKIKTYRTQFNARSYFYSEKFQTMTQNVIWLYTGLLEEDDKNWITYQTFLLKVHDDLDAYIRKELGLEASLEKEFKYKSMTQEEINIEKKRLKFLRDNLEEFNKSNLPITK